MKKKWNLKTGWQNNNDNDDDNNENEPKRFKIVKLFKVFQKEIL